MPITTRLRGVTALESHRAPTFTPVTTRLARPGATPTPLRSVEAPRAGLLNVPASPLGAPQPIPAPELQALKDAAHVDPHKLLGPHAVLVGGKPTTQVRALFPNARAVTVVTDSGDRVPLTANAGLFEGLLPRLGQRYQLELTPTDGSPALLVEDPYRFAPTVDATQLYLFKQGTLEDTAKLLGAHPMTVDGVAGFNVVVWAPNARGVSAVGDFNGYSRTSHMMRRLQDSVFEVFIPGAKSGAVYKLSVLGSDGKRVEKADPAARASQLRGQTGSILVGADRHVWSDQRFLAARAATDPTAQPLSAYEVHLPSWKRNADGSMMNYRQLARELIPHLKKERFNAVELIGLAEHPLDDSWGYQVTGYYAPTSRHGTPEDFKAFVDEMHAAGIKILYDWVPAHFPKDAHGLATFDGTNLFDHKDPRQGEHRDWGTRIFNYGRNEVKSFLTGSLVHMLDEYHLDGVRVDAVASMLYLDYSRKDWVPNKNGGNENLEAIAFLQDVNARVAKRFPGVLKIAEESTAWPKVTKPKSEGGLGFDLKWNMGWMHDTLAFFQADPAARGAALDGLTNTLLWAHSEKYVAALSHDEVVHLKKSLLEKMPGDEWQKRANLRSLLSFMTSYPGQKLLFMGAELAQRGEWDFKSQLDWDALKNAGNQGVAALVADLNKLYATEPALSEKQFAPEGTELRVRDPKNAVVALARKGNHAEDDVLFVHNLTATPQRGYRVGVDAPGRYAEIFNSDALSYGGSGVGNLGGVDAERVPMHGKPYSVVLSLPPLGSIALKQVSTHRDATHRHVERSRRPRTLPHVGRPHTMRLPSAVGGSP